MAGLTELIQVNVSPETKLMLDEWAAADGNRAIASIIRSLIEAERFRRTQQLSPFLIQSLPHFIPNPPATLPTAELAQEKKFEYHLGPGPGDDVEEA